jgi:hypothetical protein
MSRRPKALDLGLDLEDLIATSGDFVGNCYPKNADELQSINPREHKWMLDELVDEGLLSQSRREALLLGKSMTASERKQMRARILQYRFGNPDADICPAIFFCDAPPELKDKRVVVVLSRGYGISLSLTREVFGAFRTKEAALTALRRKYFLESEVGT